MPRDPSAITKPFVNGVKEFVFIKPVNLGSLFLVIPNVDAFLPDKILLEIDLHVTLVGVELSTNVNVNVTTTIPDECILPVTCERDHCLTVVYLCREVVKT